MKQLQRWQEKIFFTNVIFCLFTVPWITHWFEKFFTDISCSTFLYRRVRLTKIRNKVWNNLIPIFLLFNIIVYVFRVCWIQQIDFIVLNSNLQIRNCPYWLNLYRMSLSALEEMLCSLASSTIYEITRYLWN